MFFVVSWERKSLVFARGAPMAIRATPVPVGQCYLSLAGTHFAPTYQCTPEKQRKAGCQPGLGLRGVTSGT